jgi:hypothetical protein
LKKTDFQQAVVVEKQTFKSLSWWENTLSKACCGGKKVIGSFPSRQDFQKYVLSTDF